MQSDRVQQSHPCSRRVQSSRSRLGFERAKAGSPRRSGKGPRFTWLSTRSCSQPESRRCLDLFRECERGGEDRHFVGSRRSLVLDADRKFHVVCVRVHFTHCSGRGGSAVPRPSSLRCLPLSFSLCAYRPGNGAALGSSTRSARHKRRLDAVMRRSSPRFDTGFLIVEIDFTRIGSVSGAVRIESDPPR